jgi:predicted dehydrogenase
MVGLQARGDPTVRHLRQLVGDGYVGDVLAVNMTVFTAGVLERPQSRLWDHDKTKGVSALTVRGIHTMAILCWCLGDFAEVSGKVSTQVKQWRVTGTDQLVDVDAADNVMVNGVLQSGAIASVHVATVPYNATAWRMEIYGRKGTLRATSNGSPQRDASQLVGSRDGGPMESLPVPATFTEVPEAMPGRRATSVTSTFGWQKRAGPAAVANRISIAQSSAIAGSTRYSNRPMKAGRSRLRDRSIFFRCSFLAAFTRTMRCP